MKKILALGLAAAGLAWTLARRGERPADTWAQATDEV